jgi:hypothetical protein
MNDCASFLSIAIIETEMKIKKEKYNLFIDMVSPANTLAGFVSPVHLSTAHLFSYPRLSAAKFQLMSLSRTAFT